MNDIGNPRSKAARVADPSWRSSLDIREFARHPEGGPALKVRFRALLIVITIAMIPTFGQTQAPSRPRLDQGGPTVEGQEVEGAIKTVDPEARTITLDNGEDYLIPVAVLTNPGVLAEGTVVKFRHGTEGGRNIVTYVQVRL